MNKTAPAPGGDKTGHSSPYPFRYYGSGCDDWSEGAMDGHFFTVQFEQAPTDAELTALGRLYEESLTTGPTIPGSDRWEWSGQFALFSVGERGQSDGAHVGAVTHFLRQAHRIVPIEDAVYVNAREGTGPWDKWSLAQGMPDPCPFPNQVGLYPRPHDASLAKPGSSQIFELARHAVRQDAERAGLLKAITRDADKPVHLQLVPADVPEPGRRHFRRGKRGKQTKRVAPKWPNGRKPRAHANRAYHPNDREQVVGNKRELFRVDLDTGDVQPLTLPPEAQDIHDICFLRAGARLLVSCEKHLLLIDPTADVPTVLAAVKRAGWRVNSILNGDGFVLKAKRGVAVYAVNALDKIKRVASSTADVEFAYEYDGRIVFCSRLSSGIVRFEYMGVVEAVGKHIARGESTSPRKRT